GIPLPEGRVGSSRLPEPTFTPSTRAATGHDRPLTFQEAADLVGPDRAARLRELTLALYRAPAEHALERGIILAHTKFEFGVGDDGGGDGELILIDEALTPDSSRVWPADGYAP